MRGFIIASVLGLAACSGIEGTIDGEEVRIKSAALLQWTVDEAEDEVLHVALASVGGVCRKLSDRITAGDTDAEAWADTWPEDWWELRLTVVADTPGDDLDDQTFNGVGWQQPDLPAGSAIVQAWHHTAPPGGAAPASFVSDGGSLVVTASRPAGRVAGAFTTTLVDPDSGESAGEVVIDFAASRCAKAEAALWGPTAPAAE